MHWLDWLFATLPVALVFAVGITVHRFVKSVADFVSANRSAGRYLLSIASGEMQAGAATFVASCEVFSHSGFVLTWWGSIGVLVGILLKISGFVTYRYRETRAMTLAQFFEIRYNKSFRLFTGCMGFLAGLLNFGVIPAIGSRVMVHFLELPDTVTIFSLTMPTYVPLMAVLQSVTLIVALSGGIITVMVVNALEGIMTQLIYIVIIITVLSIFSWSQMHTVLVDRPAGQSLVNPFDAMGVKDFNLWYVLMGVFLTVYSTMGWQNTGGFNSAGLTPHENRMGNVLTGYRELAKYATTMLLALCAITYLYHPSFSAGADGVHSIVSRISNPQEQEQMLVPVAVAQLLPIGVKGMFCAILLMGIFGGESTHLHSWGSIFVQDILVPLRKKAFGPKLHLLILRLSIIGVALFAFLFGIFFHLADYINMWWTVTTAIFTGGAGSAIIGGLYWKKGTASGAWAAFMTGSSLSVLGIITQQIYAHHGIKFLLNGTQIAFFSSLLAVLVYVVVSLMTFKEDFNLSRMLHRGEFASNSSIKENVPAKAKFVWKQLLGLDENFTRGDKWIACFLFGWSLFWFFVFVAGTIWNLMKPWPTETWAHYYHWVGFGFPIFFAMVTGIWFTWGGVRDTCRLFQKLRQEKANPLDDGTVVNHQNLDPYLEDFRTVGGNDLLPFFRQGGQQKGRNDKDCSL